MTRKVRAKQVALPRWDRRDAYGKFETWSGNRWAWEFLRRNRAFRLACEKIDYSDRQSRIAHESSIARTFALREFKHAAERYGKRGERRPSFARTPSHIAAARRSWTVAVEVDAGECLVRFNLRPATIDRKWIDEQLALARELLQDLARSSQRSESADPKKRILAAVLATRRKVAEQRIVLLRLLDAQSAGTAPAFVYRRFIAEMAEKQGKNALPRDAQIAFDVAEAYATHWYVLFALR